MSSRYDITWKYTILYNVWNTRVILFTTTSYAFGVPRQYHICTVWKRLQII